MKNIIRWLMPKEEHFFDLLVEQSRNVVEGARALHSFIDTYEKSSHSVRKEKIRAIKEIEHKGDSLQHRLSEKLNIAFITPIDKEDIHELTMLIDDLIDAINAVSIRFGLLGIEKTDKHILALAKIMATSVAEVHRSVLDLRHLKSMKKQTSTINQLEKEADSAYHAALHELFHSKKDAIYIIKYKTIYEILENITDKCKETEQVLESVVVKHA